REVATGLRTPQVQAMVNDLAHSQGQQAERLLPLVFNELGMGAQNAYRAGETILAGRATLSRPYFDRAYQQEFALTPEMQDLMRDPLVQSAWDMGRAKALREDAAGRGNGVAVPSLDILEPKAGNVSLTPQQTQDLMQQAGGDL